MGRPLNYYVVNVGRGRSATHIMRSKSASTPRGIATQLLGFGSNEKLTLCGLTATRHVNIFQPAQASCRECKARWRAAVAPDEARGRARAKEAVERLRQAEREQTQRQRQAEHDRQAERDRLDAETATFGLMRMDVAPDGTNGPGIVLGDFPDRAKARAAATRDAGTALPWTETSTPGTDIAVIRVSDGKQAYAVYRKQAA
jgi:hypothetical protein